MNAGEWCGAHDAEIRRLARGLLRRWSVPAAVTAEDVAQELRVGAVLALARYDARRGTDRSRYVWWFAHNHAKRWLHVQRGALRHSGSAPSEHPMGEAAAGVDVDQREGSAPRADDVAAFYEMLCMALAACRTSQERACFDVLLDARLDVDVASVALFADPMCGARTPREARRMVRECVQRITEVQVWRQ